jgi:hypothetical protein
MEVPKKRRKKVRSGKILRKLNRTRAGEPGPYGRIILPLSHLIDVFAGEKVK